MFRLLFRLIVLALAALGAKSLYDRLAPHADDLKATGTDLVDRASSATRDLGKSVTDATQQVVGNAKKGAEDVKATAVDAAHEVKDAAVDAQASAADTPSAAVPEFSAPSTPHDGA
jgi:hypothetical protein